MEEKLSSYTEQEIDDIMHSCRGYRKQLIEYCMRYLPTFEDAEDCVSFAFEKLMEYLRQGREVSHPKAWLYRVSLNEAIRTERSRARLHENEYTDTASKDKSMENSYSYTPDYLDELVDDETIHGCAMRIIAGLTQEERELYLLYYRGGLKLGEIAQTLGISHATARKRHQRLKAHLNYLVKSADRDYYGKGGDTHENR